MVQKKSSRRVHSYSVVGTRPSAVARVMFGTRIGRWREDLLPRTHIMAERRVANDSRHLSQPITVEYGFCCCCGYNAVYHRKLGPRTTRLFSDKPLA